MKIVVSGSKGKDARKYTTEYDFGDTLEKTIELFGREIVEDRVYAKLKINLQDYIRILMKDGKTDAEIDKALETWKPGMKVQGKTPTEKMDNLWAKLSPEEQKEQLRKWAASAKKK